MSPKNDVVLIVGTGALACLFAAKLAAAGQLVNMLGSWPEGLAALQNRGVTLLFPDGKKRNYVVHASANALDFAGAKHALVLVKSWQTEQSADQLFECLAVDGVALTLQNGLGNREKLVAKLGAERVAFGVSTGGATLLGPGEVRAGGDGRVSLGEHERIKPIAEILSDAGLDTEIVNDVESLAWSKLVVNAAINPLTALLDVPNGELLTRLHARELSAALAREVAAVAEKKRVTLAFDDAVAAAEDVAKRTADNISSMLQDVRREARTEIDAICGAVVEAGKMLGVPTPVNEIMWKLVSALRPA
ncbi:MAG: 2-dehydropantoate 2-reductase [Anaerolineales bacterium]